MPNNLTIAVPSRMEKSGYLSTPSISTFVSQGKKIEEWEQWAREEEKRRMRRKVEKEGQKIEGQAGWQW
jgi:hypothetical protein